MNSEQRTVLPSGSAHGAITPLPPTAYPFDAGFYANLVASRASFKQVSSYLTTMSGHGFAVAAGQTYRFVIVEKTQCIDVCILAADDPTEHFFSGAQMTIEGGKITRFTRLWGTPPLSRPLATCIADTLRVRESPRHTRDHFGYGAHCNAHLWHLFAGILHRPCYDNLRYGLAMMGLHQRYIHDNMNLFQKGAYDPFTGAHLIDPSDGEAGDYIEFYAEIPLIVAISLCPNGAGDPGLKDSFSPIGPDVPIYPVRVEVHDTGIVPLGWPYQAAA